MAAVCLVSFSAGCEIVGAWNDFAVGAIFSSPKLVLLPYRSQRN
jgi:hypothetical protein